MDNLLHYWPLVAFMSGLFLGGMSLAVGLTLWIMGHLKEQDGKRVEMKEVILQEVRDRHHTTMGRLDQQKAVLDERIEGIASRSNEKMDKLAEGIVGLGNRIVRVETLIINGGPEHK